MSVDTEARRAAPAPGWRSWLPRVLVESTLIVFSVLLALGVDEWREARGHRAQAAAAERAIIEELRGNRELIAASLAYHSAVHDSLVAHRRDGRAPGIQLFPRGFVSPAQLSHTAWASAAETGALSHVDYETVLRLSRVYAQQERYAEQARGIGDVLYAELYRGGMDAVLANHRNLAGLISTFRYREDALLRQYADALPDAAVR